MGRIQAFGYFGTLLACIAMLLASGAGCSHNRCPLADYNVQLPPHVQLPENFYPLVRSYQPDHEGDTYDGWPRYIVDTRDGAIMAYVPTQTILMGGGTDADAVPAREVVVNHFYMDLHEVTNAQYHRFRKACAERPDDDELGDPLSRCPRVSMDDYLEYWVPGLNNDHPVRNVSWWQAWYYARWARKELPTEAQWEAAARGDDGRLYPWGNEPYSEVTRYLCNARTDREGFDGYEYTAPVLSFAAGVSPFGIYQLAGNVAEWCRDYYDPARYAYPSDADPPTGLERGARPFGELYYPNPLEKYLRESRVGPFRGDQRVIRGGSFADPIERCRVDMRRAARPDVHSFDVGFRCVLPLPPDTGA